MSLEASFGVFAHPAQLVNALALLFVLVGGLLLLATRWREQLGRARMAEEGAPPLAGDVLVQFLQMNRQFYQLGFACLVVGLLVSLASTRL